MKTQNIERDYPEFEKLQETDFFLQRRGAKLDQKANEPELAHEGDRSLRPTVDLRVSSAEAEYVILIFKVIFDLKSRGQPVFTKCFFSALTEAVLT